MTVAHYFCSVVLVLIVPAALRAADPSVREVAAALEKAVAFYDQQVSHEGGYLWRYSEDLRHGEGEGAANRTAAWVQPPGTPSVGMALLRGYQRTEQPQLLAAARRAAHALVRGQLESGGWDYRIEFEPAARTRYRYRVDEDRPRASNTTTLDDNTTQAALQFLLQMDQALEFKDPVVHDAALYALQKLIAAQYPNGAWPQRFSEPPDPEAFPVRPASYPPEWSKSYPKPDYRSYYTFNDNTLADMVDTMFLAADTYGEPVYAAAARRGGDFILLAQMPDPQPAWAQQYSPLMHPAWARKFEPPAITGGESQGVLKILLKIYRETGEPKYLEPFPRALDYLTRSELPDGQLARFYELQTNRPLYFTQDYELVYHDRDLPTHYAFKVRSALDSIRREYEALKAASPEKLAARSEKRPERMTEALRRSAGDVIRQMDDRGAWAEKGALKSAPEGQGTGRILDMRTYARNLDILTRFLAAEAAR